MHKHDWKVTYTHSKGHLVTLRCKRCPETATAEVGRIDHSIEVFGNAGVVLELEDA